MWVPSYLDACEADGYNWSGTYLNKNHSISYASGATVEGPMYQDDITIAGLTANDMQFFVVNQTYCDVNRDNNNAIIGVEYRTKSNNHGIPLFFENLITQGKVDVPDFGFYFGPKNETDVRGELTLGGRDTTKFTGQPVTAPVYEQGFWKFMIDGASVNGKLIPGTGGKGIIQTSSLLPSLYPFPYLPNHY